MCNPLASEARVEYVSDSIAEKIEAEGYDENRQAGE